MESDSSLVLSDTTLFCFKIGMDFDTTEPLFLTNIFLPLFIDCNRLNASALMALPF